MAVLIAAGLAAAGGIASGVGTAQAQNQANSAGARAAAQQGAASFFNYLSSRGINIQAIAAANPTIVQSYQQLQAQGDKRDFQTFIYQFMQANPTTTLWNAIDNPTTANGGAQNTTLPTWATTGTGAALQPALLQQLLTIANANGVSGLGSGPGAVAGPQSQLQNATAYLAANPDIQAQIQQNLTASGDSRSPAQWMLDDAATGDTNPAFTTNFQNFVTAQGAPAAAGNGTGGSTAGGAATPPATTGVDPAIQALINSSNGVAGNIFDGTFLKQQLAALQPALDARSAAPGQIYDATISGAQGIQSAEGTAANSTYQANVDQLAKLLGVQTSAAKAIYDASISGAQGVNTAQLAQAQTYQDAGDQASTAAIAANNAQRARQGFVGSSSGNDLQNARILASYIQQGAGARAQAGVNLAQSTANAGLTQAQSVGGAQTSDQQQQMAAAVALAQQLGASNVNYATTAGNAGVAKATGSAQADYQNAIDKMNALITDQNRQVSAVGLPYDLANAQLVLQKNEANAPYDGVDALTSRLGQFSINQAGGPAPSTFIPQPVINTAQIAGGALTAAGQVYGNSASTTSLLNILKSLQGPSTSGTPSVSGSGATGTITGSGGAPTDLGGGVTTLLGSGGP